MMTARSRGYNQDWDPMREDFDDSSYDPQTADDNSSGYVNLDHCRLYVTNIPSGLSDDGLSTAFSKFGRLTEVFVSKNPDKRYGLVAFETSGEAKLAMMKLNRTEPLNLKISIAHKSNAKSKRQEKSHNSGYRSNNSNGPRNRDDRSIRDETGSNASRSNPRRQDSMANGDNMEDLIDDDVGLSGTLEPDVNLELEKLKLEHLKLQEAQVLCKHRMLLLKQAERKSSAGSRCILPDGRIVVRNADKGESHDADGSFGAGAGDAPKIPGLQSFGACVACGQRAEAFCSGCRVTPYCSPACQRRDWAERHRNTCHNLKRPSAGIASRLEIESEPPAAPLRRPRSPGPSPRDSGNDRFPPRKFGPPGSATTPTPAAKSYNNARGAGGHSRAGHDADKGPAERGQSDRGRLNRSNDDDNRPNARTNDRNRDNGRRNGDRTDGPRNQDGGKRTYGQSRPKEDEDWGPKPSEKPAPKPSPVAKEQPSPKVAPTAEAASPARPIASVADVAPVSARKPAPLQSKPAPAQTKPSTPALVPKNCVIDTLALKDTFILTADTPAEGSGFICVTLHVDHSDNYERLMEPLSRACEASAACEPRPGDTFAYLDPRDGGWYRARCLAPARAALLDAARVAALAPEDQCRRLHADYAVIPEFCCQLESDQVQLKDQVQCTIVSKSGSDLSVTITNFETGVALGVGTVRRWLPAVEWPQEAPAAPRTEPASASGPAKATAAAPGEPPQVPRPAATAGEPPQVPRPAAPAGEPPQVPRPAAPAGEPPQVPRPAAPAGEPPQVPRPAAPAGEPPQVPRPAAPAGEPPQVPRPAAPAGEPPQVPRPAAPAGEPPQVPRPAAPAGEPPQVPRPAAPAGEPPQVPRPAAPAGEPPQVPRPAAPAGEPPQVPRPAAPAGEPPQVPRPAAPAGEPPQVPRPAAPAGEPPQVPRPAAPAGAAYLLVEAAGPERLFVRPADLALQSEFNEILCEVALYGSNEATPRLTELPAAGQTVVARFTDGNHYRALVQRVNSKNRRCLLEYIEYGNAAIVEDLQSLCPCPPHLEPRARPTLTSAVALHMKQKSFSAAATAYLDKLKDDEEQLTLTIPSGETSGPSKTAVRLTVVKSGEDVNRTVDTLSTPEWQKLLERGGDVLETETLFFQDITYAELPGAATELDIFDCSLLEHGMLSGHARGADHAKRAHALAAQLNEYCNSALAKDPYTPKCEELCIALCPNRKQWLRAVLLEQIGGPGGAEAQILFYDYGHMLQLPIASLRKMMPEFARGIPAAAVTLQIKDFPPHPTEEQQARARRHLRLSERGVGALRVARVARQDLGEYAVEAPELLRALA